MLISSCCKMEDDINSAQSQLVIIIDIKTKPELFCVTFGCGNDARIENSLTCTCFPYILQFF